jgi:cysteine-rich repeat protein
MRWQRQSIFLTIVILHVTHVHSIQYCGNGQLQIGEECDDGNIKNGDGCDETCHYEDACKCAIGNSFICTNYVYNNMGNMVTRCCKTLLNPVTMRSVCNCIAQQSLSPFYTIDKDCQKQDINECEVSNGGCAVNAICMNMDGRLNISANATIETHGRTCVCPSGLFGDGYLRCDRKLFGVNIMLNIENTPYQMNLIGLDWIITQVNAFIAEFSNVYLNNVTSVDARHLLQWSADRQILAESYDHAVVTLSVSTYDQMMALVRNVNANAIAAFLQDATLGLSVISVMQQATAIVTDATPDLATAVSYAPGFMLDNITYNMASTIDAINVDSWLLDAHFFAPPNTIAALFLSKSHSGILPNRHECMLSNDVCCLHRMLQNHYMGAFADWVSATISPWCVNGFPNATALHMPSNEIIASISDTTEMTNAWIPQLFNGFEISRVLPSNEPDRPTKVRILLSQTEIINKLAQNINNTHHRFSVGAVFFRPTNVPSMYTVVGNTLLDVVTSNTLSTSILTQQRYTILEYIDLSVHAIQYKASTFDTVHNLQYARVNFILPANVTVPSQGLVSFSSSRIMIGTGTTVDALWR